MDSASFRIESPPQIVGQVHFSEGVAEESSGNCGWWACSRDKAWGVLGNQGPGGDWFWDRLGPGPEALGLCPHLSLEKDAFVVSEEAMQELGSSILGVPAH